MTASPPTAREVIAWALSSQQSRTAEVLHGLAKAGLTEAQLDAILAGEAVVVPKNPSAETIMSGISQSRVLMPDDFPARISLERAEKMKMASIYRMMVLQASQEPSK